LTATQNLPLATVLQVIGFNPRSAAGHYRVKSVGTEPLWSGAAVERQPTTAFVFVTHEVPRGPEPAGEGIN
jgi:hypothetical protein